MYPCATKRALYRSTESSDLSFVFYIHLLSTTFMLDVCGTRTQVLFWSKARSSSCLASNHTGLFKSSLSVFESFLKGTVGQTGVFGVRLCDSHSGMSYNRIYHQMWYNIITMLHTSI